MLVFEQDGDVLTGEVQGLTDGAHEPEHRHLDEMDQHDLCDALLEALVTMASKSRRRQADLSAALLRSGINGTAEQVREALVQLQSSGCIREFVPLYDGGMLLTVTNLGMDRTGRNPHWRFLEKLMPLAA